MIIGDNVVELFSIVFGVELGLLLVGIRTDF